MKGKGPELRYDEYIVENGTKSEIEEHQALLLRNIDYSKEEVAMLMKNMERAKQELIKNQVRAQFFAASIKEAAAK